MHRALLLSARHAELGIAVENPEKSDAVMLNAIAALHAHDAHLLDIAPSCTRARLILAAGPRRSALPQLPNTESITPAPSSRNTNWPCKALPEGVENTPLQARGVKIP